MRAGRVYSKRSAGKLVFYDVKADGEKIQIMADVALSAGGNLAAFVALHNGVKIGDIIGAAGHPGKSKKGELSLFPTAFRVLSPCLHMLPLRRLDNQVGSGPPAPTLAPPGFSICPIAIAYIDAHSPVILLGTCLLNLCEAAHATGDMAVSSTMLALLPDRSSSILACCQPLQ